MNALVFFARVSHILCRSLRVSVGDSMSPSSKPFEARGISPLSCSGGILSVLGRLKILKEKIQVIPKRDTSDQPSV
jgi:hypothetical protein